MQTKGLVNMILMMVILSSVPFGIGTTFCMWASRALLVADISQSIH
jgi:hypothetical protein